MKTPYASSDEDTPERQESALVSAAPPGSICPLTHAPGTAQVDFGQALAIVNGVECTVHVFALDLETNYSHASSSLGPAQKQTTSFRDKDEYRVDLGVVDIMLFSVKALGVVSVRPMDSDTTS